MVRLKIATRQSPSAYTTQAGRTMTRPSKFTLLLWLLAAALGACGSTEGSEKAGGKSGAGGTGQGPAAGGSSAGDASAGGPSAGDASAGGPSAGGPSAGGPSAGGLSAGGPSAGGATLGAAGQGTAGAAASFGLPGASAFTRFTLHSFGHILTGPNGECQVPDPADNTSPYDSTWSFDRASRTLTWDACNESSKTVQHGNLALSDSEVQALLNLVSSLTPTQQKTGDPCRADGSYAEMDLEVGATTTRYRASSGWCGAPPSEKNAVDGLIALWSWVRSKSQP